MLDDDDEIDDDWTVPQKPGQFGHPPSAENVMAGYKNLVTWMGTANEAVGPGMRATVPLSVQWVIADYIRNAGQTAEVEAAIASIQTVVQNEKEA